MKKILILAAVMFSGMSCKQELQGGKHSPKMEEYQLSEKKNVDRFRQKITQAGECWSNEYSPKPQANFLKATTIREPAHMFLAKDNGYILFAQPDSHCQETLNTSRKCEYWIRHIHEERMHVFFKEESVKVPCPRGVTIGAIIKQASSVDKQLYDFSKITSK